MNSSEQDQPLAHWTWHIKIQQSREQIGSVWRTIFGFILSIFSSSKNQRQNLDSSFRNLFSFWKKKSSSRNSDFWPVIWCRFQSSYGYLTWLVPGEIKWTVAFFFFCLECWIALRWYLVMIPSLVPVIDILFWPLVWYLKWTVWEKNWK